MSKAASVRQRLKNISKIDESVSFQTILIRYFHERLLYRLSISSYKNNFLLKGGALVYVLENEITRPTRDIDFLGLAIENSEENIKNVFETICQIDDCEDAVVFDTNSITVGSINEADKYQGIRINIDCGLDTIRQRIQIDIGFGDAIYPKPEEMEFPLLLKDNPSVNIKVYPVETIIAEKVHAMITLSLFNSRMKDFYDVYYLLRGGGFNPQSLQKAIKHTFDSRKTKVSLESELFTNQLYEDEQMNERWKHFLSKNKLRNENTFKTVVLSIQEGLEPIWSNLINGNDR